MEFLQYTLMKQIERITITKADLRPSKTLGNAGYLMYPYKDGTGKEEEYPLMIHCSDPDCFTEQQALDSLNTKLEPLFEAMPGLKIYSMDGEIKVWHGESKLPGIPDQWVAYEAIIIPGVTIEQIRELMKIKNQNK